LTSQCEVHGFLGLVRKNLAGIHKKKKKHPWTLVNTSGMNWTTDSEPGLITQYHWLSIMVMGLNVSKSLKPLSTLVKNIPKIVSYYRSKGILDECFRYPSVDGHRVIFILLYMRMSCLF